MTTLFIILVVLFAALFILVPILEKYVQKEGKGGRGGGTSETRATRWIIPLMAAVMILAILRHYFG